MATAIAEIPTIKRVKNQASTPYRSARHVLEVDVASRYAEYASLYYLETNWLFSGSWGVWTPERQEIDLVQSPGIRQPGFRDSCNAYRNLKATEPVELLEPARIETYVDQKFTGTPGTSRRQHVENWISYEVYPIRGDKRNSLNRRFVDTIRKLSRCRRPQWWRTEHDSVFAATDPTNGGRLIGLVAAVQKEEPKRKRGAQ